MCRPSSYSFVDISHWPDFVIDNILVIHAASGCDTTSSLAGVGKTKLIKATIKRPALADQLPIFREADANRDRLQKSGLSILTAMYTTKGTTQFKDIRLWWV